MLEAYAMDSGKPVKLDANPRPGCIFFRAALGDNKILVNDGTAGLDWRKTSETCYAGQTDTRPLWEASKWIGLVTTLR